MVFGDVPEPGVIDGWVGELVEAIHSWTVACGDVLRAEPLTQTRVDNRGDAVLDGVRGQGQVGQIGG